MQVGRNGEAPERGHEGVGRSDQEWRPPRQETPHPNRSDALRTKGRPLGTRRPPPLRIGREESPSAQFSVSTSSDVFPRNPLRVSGKHASGSPFNLCGPGRLDVCDVVLVVVETGEQLGGHLRTFRGSKSQRFAKNVLGSRCHRVILDHTACCSMSVSRFDRKPPAPEGLQSQTCRTNRPATGFFRRSRIFRRPRRLMTQLSGSSSWPRSTLGWRSSMPVAAFPMTRSLDAWGCDW